MKVFNQHRKHTDISRGNASSQQETPQPSLLQRQRSGEIGKRGREYQIPRRYELQRNISRAPSMGKRRSIPVHGTGNGDFDSLVHENFPEDLKNTVALKRHSIGSIGGNGSYQQALDTYDEHLVFKTTVPGSRNFSFEQNSQNAINDYLSRQRMRSVDLTNNSNNSRDARINSRFYGHNYMQQRKDTVGTQTSFKNGYLSKDSMPENLFGRCVSSRSGLSNSGSEHSDIPNCAVSNRSDEFDASVNSTDNEEVYMMQTESDRDEQDENENTETENLEDQNRGNADEMSSSSMWSDLENKSTVTRTQLRKLALKQGFENLSMACGEVYEENGEDPHRPGRAWLDPASYQKEMINISTSSSSSVAPAAKDGKQARKFQKVWTHSTLAQRNRHESTTNTLRGLVRFGLHPMLESLERMSPVHPTSISTTNFTPSKIQSQYRMELHDMWGKACREHELVSTEGAFKST